MNGNDNKKIDLLEELTDSNEEITNLIEKYDAESRYRNLSGIQGEFITIWLAAMSVFHLATAGVITMPLAIQRAIHLLPEKEIKQKPRGMISSLLPEVFAS